MICFQDFNTARGKPPPIRHAIFEIARKVKNRKTRDEQPEYNAANTGAVTTSPTRLETTPIDYEPAPVNQESAFGTGKTCPGA